MSTLLSDVQLVSCTGPVSPLPLRNRYSSCAASVPLQRLFPIVPVSLLKFKSNNDSCSMVLREDGTVPTSPVAVEQCRLWVACPAAITMQNSTTGMLVATFYSKHASYYTLVCFTSNHVVCKMASMASVWHTWDFNVLFLSWKRALTIVAQA